VGSIWVLTLRFLSRGICLRSLPHLGYLVRAFAGTFTEFQPQSIWATPFTSPSLIFPMLMGKMLSHEFGGNSCKNQKPHLWSECKRSHWSQKNIPSNHVHCVSSYHFSFLIY
jgi:hypothetical protein